MRTARRVNRLAAALLAAAVAVPATAGGYGYGHIGYGAHYRSHGHGDAAAALLAGLVIGGLTGYFISEDRYRQRSYYAPPAYYPPPPPRRYTVIEAPAPTAAAPAAGEFADCVMTREYTAVVNVDGRQRDAYGTRCLRADGSWELGRLKLAPEFN